MRRRAFLGGALVAATAQALAQGPTTATSAGGGPDGAVAMLAGLLERGYVVPATGQRLATMLRARQAAGAYRAATTPSALAALLTDDLRGLVDDRHLRVMQDDGARPGAPSPATPSRFGPPRTPALQDAGWLGSGIAYLRYTGFTGEPATVAATQAFMRDHAGATALVIDCRYNGGGGIDEMNVILPYLFATETPLVRMEMAEPIFAARGLPFEGPTIRPVASAGGVVRNVHVATPRADETRWRGAKVFYLTSPRTASAAEHLALAFRHTGRATLIGGTTAGANHFGGMEPLGWGLAVFLPVGRTVDLTTGADWEGSGIAPDVTVPPAQVLEEALRRAGVGMTAAT